MPCSWPLPSLTELEKDLSFVIAECNDKMQVTSVVFEDELKKGKASTGVEG